VQPNLEEDLEQDTSQLAPTTDTATLDPFLVRAAFFQKRFVEEFGSEEYFKMIRKAYLSQPLSRVAGLPLTVS
jgi:hypothetical protein